MPKSCKSCTQVLMTESSATGFRCGLAYFSQPPAERKMQRMDAYPPTHPDAVCDHHEDHEHKLRTDLSARGRPS